MLLGHHYMRHKNSTPEVRNMKGRIEIVCIKHDTINAKIFTRFIFRCNPRAFFLKLPRIWYIIVNRMTGLL